VYYEDYIVHRTAKMATHGVRDRPPVMPNIAPMRAELELMDRDLHAVGVHIAPVLAYNNCRLGADAHLTRIVAWLVSETLAAAR